MIAAVILAAGASSRMGRPKATLKLGGVTFLETIIRAVRGAAFDHALVAMPLDVGKILTDIDLTSVSIVVNTEPVAAGPIGSIRAAIRRIVNQPVDYLLVWHVDQPHVMVETILKLRTAFEASEGASVAVPTFGGRRGHPVIFGRETFQELLDAPDDEGARFVVGRFPARVLEVPVDDPAVTEDINTPDDYARLISSTESLH